MTITATKHTPTAERIMALSGTSTSECSCDKCKGLCRTPCIGTPEDIEELINAGYGERLAITHWAPGMLLGLTKEPIMMLQPLQEATGWCTFRTPDGLCELHGKGLKPLEGRLTSCRPRQRGWNIMRDFTWLIAKEWLPLQGQFRQIKKI